MQFELLNNDLQNTTVTPTTTKQAKNANHAQSFKLDIVMYGFKKNIDTINSLINHFGTKKLFDKVAIASYLNISSGGGHFQRTLRGLTKSGLIVKKTETEYGFTELAVKVQQDLEDKTTAGLIELLCVNPIYEHLVKANLLSDNITLDHIAKAIRNNVGNSKDESDILAEDFKNCISFISSIGSINNDNTKNTSLNESEPNLSQTLNTPNNIMTTNVIHQDIPSESLVKSARVDLSSGVFTIQISAPANITEDDRAFIQYVIKTTTKNLLGE